MSEDIEQLGRRSTPPQPGARGRPRAFWPAVIALAAFAAVFALSAPVSCTTTQDVMGVKTLELCRSVTGIPYGGSTAGDFLPALLFGATVAVPVAIGLRSLQRRRRDVGPSR